MVGHSVAWHGREHVVRHAAMLGSMVEQGMIGQSGVVQARYSVHSKTIHRLIRIHIRVLLALLVRMHLDRFPAAGATKWV